MCQSERMFGFLGMCATLPGYQCVPCMSSPCERKRAPFVTIYLRVCQTLWLPLCQQHPGCAVQQAQCVSAFGSAPAWLC